MWDTACLVLFAVFGIAVIILTPVWPYLARMMDNRRIRKTRERRLRAGRCPSCNYDRRGLAADAPCPECGAAPARS